MSQTMGELKMELAHPSALTCLAEPVRSIITKEFVEIVERVKKRDGISALDMPRTTAIVHEAGHVIVGVHEGLGVKYVRVGDLTRNGRIYWGGYVLYTSGRWHMSENTKPEDDLKHVRTMIAGVIAERLFDPKNYRELSGLDEILVAQTACMGIAPKLNTKQEDLWQLTWNHTKAILIYNKTVVRELMAKLKVTGSLRNTPLKSTVSKVRQVPEATPTAKAA
jgi:hypothetical protein